MNISKKWFATFGAITAFGVASSAGAAVFVWTGGGSGGWTDHMNWDGPANEYPDDSSDTARFDSVTVTLALDANIVIGSIELRATSSAPVVALQNPSTQYMLTIVDGDGIDLDAGSLTIAQNVTLRPVHGGGSAHPIDAQLIVDQGRLLFARASGSAVARFEGSGSLIGADPGSTIEVEESGDQFYSEVLIQGEMTFTGAGYFKNEYQVLANAANPIVFGANLDLDDIAAAEWNMDGGILRFQKAETLAAPFNAQSGGQIYVEQDVLTTDTFNNPNSDCSAVDGVSGKKFSWTDGVPTSCTVP